MLKLYRNIFENFLKLLFLIFNSEKNDILMNISIMRDSEYININDW